MVRNHYKGLLIQTKLMRLTLKLTAALLILAISANGQTEEITDSSDHVLTIFVIKSLKPLNWESPSALVKSTMKGYKAKLCHHRQYMLGHMIARLESPLVGGTSLSAMVSKSMKEKRKLMMREKVGLGILGVALGGKLDSERGIQQDLKLFSRIEKIAYVRYRISEESARNIVLFQDAFSYSPEGKQPASSHYGGAFWPLYSGEGAGCSAYAMAMIEVAGLMGPEHRHWKVEINIPLDLIGGDLNQGKKVSSGKLKRSLNWSENDDSSDQSYIPFAIYDPTFAFEWIMKQQGTASDYTYVREEGNGIPGLFSDKRSIKPKVGESLFSERAQPSIFIEDFKRKLQK